MLGFHPFEVEPALEAAPVGQAGEHVDRRHHGQAIIGRDQFALAFGKLRRHRVKRTRQRHKFRRQTLCRRARRPVALAKAFGHRRHHADRLDDELFRADQRAEQHEQADESELKIGGVDLAVDGGRNPGFVDADDQARSGAGNAHEVDFTFRTVGGAKRSRSCYPRGVNASSQRLGRNSAKTH